MKIKKKRSRLINGRCLVCHHFGVGRRIRCALGGMDRILCSKCKKDWAYSASGGYIRARSLVSPWYHQNALRKGIAIILAKAFGLRRSQIVSEVSFPSWGVSEGGGLLRFDIAVPTLGLLVDYHGEGHYLDIYDEETTKRQRHNDKLKTKLAPKAGWLYIVFTYREDVEDLKWLRKKILPPLKKLRKRR